jgi:dihydrofolate reductase
MPELLVDFITSLDGYASAEGWPGFWGLDGPEYLAWLDDSPERDYTALMGATTYRLMSDFAATSDDASFTQLTAMSKVVFSSTLTNPLAWANTRLVDQDPVEAVRSMKEAGAPPLRTIGSLTLCRSLLQAGLVDRFRVVVFPVITGSTGQERIYDGYPDGAWKWSPAGRSMAGCSSSSTCPPSSPVRRAAVRPPELRQECAVARNKMSGVSRSQPGRFPREQYETSTDGRFF